MKFKVFWNADKVLSVSAFVKEISIHYQGQVYEGDPASMPLFIMKFGKL